MEQSQEIKDLATALCKAQAVMQGAVKDSSNPFFGSKYADLESVWGACRKPLTDNGLAIIQTSEPHPDGVCIVTTLTHNSGQWIRGKLVMKPSKPDPQGIGATITYGRRFALAAMVGVIQVDDDGETAVGRGAPAQPKQAAAQPAQAQARKQAFQQKQNAVNTAGDFGL